MVLSDLQNPCVSVAPDVVTQTLVKPGHFVSWLSRLEEYFQITFRQPPISMGDLMMTKRKKKEKKELEEELSIISCHIKKGKKILHDLYSQKDK